MLLLLLLFFFSSFLVRCGNDCLRCQRGDYVDVIVNACVPFCFVLSYARQYLLALDISTQKFLPQRDKMTKSKYVPMSERVKRRAAYQRTKANGMERA